MFGEMINDVTILYVTFWIDFTTCKSDLKRDVKRTHILYYVNVLLNEKVHFLGKHKFPVKCNASTEWLIGALYRSTTIRENFLRRFSTDIKINELFWRRNILKHIAR